MESWRRRWLQLQSVGGRDDPDGLQQSGDQQHHALEHWISGRRRPAPSVSTVTAVDPFFGFYSADIPTTQVLSSYAVNKPGANIGAGVAFGTRWHAKLYAEARYHHMFMSNGQRMDYVPVTFEVRW